MFKATISAITMTVAVSLLPLEVMADPAQVQGGLAGSRNFGNKMGQFMNSFMEGLDDPSIDKDGKKQPDQQPSPNIGAERKPQSFNRSNRGWGSKNDRNVYDPWGAADRHNRRNSYRAPFYDPWGTTDDQSGFTRFADRDWEAGRGYYGGGTTPWSNQGPPPYPDNNQQNGWHDWENNEKRDSYSTPDDGSWGLDHDQDWNSDPDWDSGQSWNGDRGWNSDPDWNSDRDWSSDPDWNGNRGWNNGQGWNDGRGWR